MEKQSIKLYCLDWAWILAVYAASHIRPDLMLAFSGIKNKKQLIDIDYIIAVCQHAMWNRPINDYWAMQWSTPP